MADAAKGRPRKQIKYDESSDEDGESSDEVALSRPAKRRRREVEQNFEEKGRNDEDEASSGAGQRHNPSRHTSPRKDSPAKFNAKTGKEPPKAPHGTKITPARR